jgi:alpha-glucosidase
MLLLTLPGTLTIYYGDEIGMTNALIRPEDVQDPAEKRQPGIGMGRDPERTPMPWDCSEMAGFTHGRPWLPLVADHRAVNVEVEEGDGASILNLYRRLIALRGARPMLVGGQLRSLTTSGDLLSYERASENERLAIFLNFGHGLVQVATEAGTVLAGTDSRRNTERVHNFIELQGSEGVVVEVVS